MTINAPASLLLLLYELVAERQGVPGERLRGTVQNDILKEYAARGNYIFPPRPSMRITTDLFAYCRERLPRWNTISISGYHIREAGATAVQELAFTLANGIAYCEAAVAAGLSPDEFGERLSFFFNAHNHFFQEVAKFRAARRLWAQIMRERFGSTNPRAQALRFHAQTGGSTLTAQQPENNVVRVAVQALSAVCGGAQSLHTNGYDEALALPTERSAQIALRTQQILQHEAGTTDTADPLGGSYFIESLTRELEERARELIGRVDELGGAVAAVEQGFVQAEVEEAAFRYAREVETGDRVIVGVNRFQVEGEEAEVELHSLDPEAERRQIERTRRLRAERDGPAARGSSAAGSGDRARRRRTCCRPCAPPWPRSARSGRSATRCARSSAPTTRTRRRSSPGPAHTPTLGGDPSPTRHPDRTVGPDVARMARGHVPDSHVGGAIASSCRSKLTRWPRRTIVRRRKVRPARRRASSKSSPACERRPRTRAIPAPSSGSGSGASCSPASGSSSCSTRAASSSSTASSATATRTSG